MSRAKRDVRLTFYQNFACSGIAGFTSRTITAPLDVIKIRRQIGTADSQDGVLQATMQFYRSEGIKAFWRKDNLLQASAQLYRREGIKAFWKGNLIACLRLLPFAMIQLGTYHKLRLWLMDEHGRLSAHTAMVAGSGAGLLATVVMYPTDTIKTRLIAQDSKKPHYKGAIDAFQLIIRDEGPAALYKGLSASVLGVLPYAGATFAVYEFLTHLYAKSHRYIGHETAFLNGCMASAIAQTLSFPCDTIKKKMQASSHVLPCNGNVDIQFVGMKHAFEETVRKNGVSGLWRGLIPNLLRVMPYTGVMFMMYETCKKVCLYSNGYTLSPFEDVPDPLVDQSLRPHELCLDGEDCDVSQLAMLQAEDD